MPVSGDCLDRLVKMKMERARERVALMNAEYPGFGNKSGASECNPRSSFSHLLFHGKAKSTSTGSSIEVGVERVP